jgi:hypothetical protein
VEDEVPAGGQQRPDMLARVRAYDGEGVAGAGDAKDAALGTGDTLAVYLPQPKHAPLFGDVQHDGTKRQVHMVDLIAEIVFPDHAAAAHGDLLGTTQAQ